jgi:hypothetical protein
MGFLLWIALLGGLSHRLAGAQHQACLSALCLAALPLVLAASAYGAYRWSEHANAYATARPALEALRSSPELRWLYPDEAELLRRAAWLRDQHLALWRE